MPWSRTGSSTSRSSAPDVRSAGPIRPPPNMGPPRSPARRRTSANVGYTLGGGLSWHGRKHGIGANQVTVIELVTADGEFVRTDA